MMVRLLRGQILLGAVLAVLSSGRGLPLVECWSQEFYSRYRHAFLLDAQAKSEL
jgi:hypothetical protein